ncbi:MAG: TIGR02646 family protein [Gammaproteobacteria bacterium]|nr:TIGR02646 family protein [Gammaproteobacteria bacterium]
MHRLTRSSQPPVCLANYHHGRNHWKQITPAEKDEIWQKLEQMQQHRCAYCEAAISSEGEHGNRHIEHFRQRSRYPQGTFAWSNLFGSCNREERCGKHKDKLPPYEHHDLIKPDSEDPEAFLQFLPDGNVAPVDGLSLSDQKRAEETIRIFNLNGSLRQIRETMIKGYLQTAEEFADLAAQYDESEWLPLLQAELRKIDHLPFATAIKQTLLPN